MTRRSRLPIFSLPTTGGHHGELWFLCRHIDKPGAPAQGQTTDNSLPAGTALDNRPAPHDHRAAHHAPAALTQLQKTERRGRPRLFRFMPHDTLGRRSRTHPQSTGKSIAPQPTDLDWFRKLAEHGPLPSSYLLAFTRHRRRSAKRSQERLTDLFNEDRTRHGGRYLTRPPQQFRTLDSRYNQLVYDLAPAGWQALSAVDLMPSTTTSGSGPWLHRLMVACVTASIELATIDRPDVFFIPGHEILARAGAELRYPVSIADPASSETLAKTLIPDALFGLRYRTPGGDRFRFFVVECDRATEPATSSNWSRKSWLRSLLQYQSYIGGGAYRDHLKLTAPLLVLTVTTDARRLKRMISVTLETTGALPYLLFQTWPAFGPVWRPPQPNPDLLTGPWHRAGHAPFRIDQP